ncbi:MAG: DUF481 domain-containing protein [Acidobacteriota bacterium]|nr:DUF481 domain-containing protein [Acidobacteriota bacterium]
MRNRIPCDLINPWIPGCSKDHQTNSFASLSASINRHFGLNTSIQVIYERKPVPGYKHKDFYLLSSFVIKI